ncbi:MAG: hypothetical protein WC473_05345 [Patescibacteria group bacterium]|jgi:hypothetical protein
MPDREKVNGIHLRYLVIEAINITLRGAGVTDRELLFKMYEMVVDEDFPARLWLAETQEESFRVKIGRLFELQFIDGKNRVLVHIVNNRHDRSANDDGDFSGQIRARPLVEVARHFIRYAHDIDPLNRSEKAVQQNLEALGIKINN